MRVSLWLPDFKHRMATKCKEVQGRNHSRLLLGVSGLEICVCIAMAFRFPIIRIFSQRLQARDAHVFGVSRRIARLGADASQPHDSW